MDELLSFENVMWGGLAAIAGVALWLLGRQRRPPATKAEILHRLASTDATTAAAALEAVRGAGWLSDGTLIGARLSHAALTRANLAGALLQRAHLDSARLGAANLTAADLNGADLSNADLGGAKLDLADLRAARLAFANLHGATLRGANLAGADLTVTCLVDTAYNDSTVWPVGFTAPDAGAHVVRRSPASGVVQFGK